MFLYLLQQRMRSNNLTYSPSPKKVSFEDYPTPNRKVYLQIPKRSVSRSRRHKIFGEKSKSKIVQSPIITSKVSEMQKKIDELTLTLFCKQKRELELERKISKALSNKSQEVITLEKQILDMYQTMRIKDHEIRTLELQVERASRCSRIIQENRELESNLQQSKLEYISKQSTTNSFIEGSGIVRNRRSEKKSYHTYKKEFGSTLDNILSPFALEQNNWK